MPLLRAPPRPLHPLLHTRDRPPLHPPLPLLPPLPPSRLHPPRENRDRPPLHLPLPLLPPLPPSHRPRRAHPRHSNPMPSSTSSRRNTFAVISRPVPWKRPPSASTNTMAASMSIPA